MNMDEHGPLMDDLPSYNMMIFQSANCDNIYLRMWMGNGLVSWGRIETESPTKQIAGKKNVVFGADFTQEISPLR